MNNKPSWDDAPEWANWLAMDSDGSWYWFQNKPYEGNVVWHSEAGHVEPVNVPDWKDTLESREDANK